ncbi:MAG: GntR family transcriptional regulator [Candidatus Krumholzibacteriia bacterium]
MFERKPLRAQVQREIRDRIFDGRLPAGASLNEPRLSAELGISRTPLREAMLGLEANGFLTSTMGRGFLVPPLDAAEFRDLAAVLARLEPLALELGPDLPGGRVMELQNLLQRAKLSVSQPGPRAAAAVAGLPSGFAVVLLAACPNRTLATDVLRLEALTARYWHAAVTAGLATGPLMAYAEELYADIQGRRRTAAAALVAEKLFALADQAAAVLP